jgi:hypothetical protein
MSVVQRPSSTAAQLPSGAGSEATVYIKEGYLQSAQSAPIHLDRYPWHEFRHYKPDAQPVRPCSPHGVACLLCAQLQSQRQFVSKSEPARIGWYVLSTRDE